LGALRSSSARAIELESVCPPIDMKYRWLSGKCLLKHVAYNALVIVNLFCEVTLSWRFTPKRRLLLLLLQLASHVRNIQAAEQVIIRNRNRLSIFSASFSALLATLNITIDPLFLNILQESLLFLPNCSVNAYFQYNTNHNYPNSTLIFTDGSVSSSSAGYSFFSDTANLSFTITYPILLPALLLNFGL